MADNNSVAGGFTEQQITKDIIIVQTLVNVFLCINMLLITTFFKKESFHTSARYILFALILLSDSLILILTDIMLFLSYFQCAIQIWICVIISVLLFLYTLVTPVTLTAMTLERYVAICMPLRHAELCSKRSTIHCIIIIHGISSVPTIAIFSVFFASVSLSVYIENKICLGDVFYVYMWQHHLSSALCQFYFLIMCTAIVFSYYKIMKAAKAVSGNERNNESIKKGLRTVILHAFQLLLCLFQLWSPIIDNALLQIDYNVSVSVGYINYVMFYLAPRCLNPLIYGLKDEIFLLALKSYFGWKRAKHGAKGYRPDLKPSQQHKHCGLCTGQATQRSNVNFKIRLASH
ncbi:odorant receptor 131-2-like [Cololabis saira]|uniref:odorant receptor 131-2-like n=1 Tax=Cololabis saira TaxID=129043 RepID=UPI002AD3DF14|nr:odorant receptor 131-2-like [Cololabis saira]